MECFGVQEAEKCLYGSKIDAGDGTMEECDMISNREGSLS